MWWTKRRGIRWLRTASSTHLKAKQAPLWAQNRLLKIPRMMLCQSRLLQPHGALVLVLVLVLVLMLGAMLLLMMVLVLVLVLVVTLGAIQVSELLAPATPVPQKLAHQGHRRQPHHAHPPSLLPTAVGQRECACHQRCPTRCLFKPWCLWSWMTTNSTFSHARRGVFNQSPRGGSDWSVTSTL